MFNIEMRQTFNNVEFKFLQLFPDVVHDFLF